MRDRYLALVSGGSDAPSEIADAMVHHARRHGFAMIQRRRLIMMTTCAPLIVGTGDTGAMLLGEIVRRGDRRPLERFEEREATHIAVTAGAAMTTSHWGSFVGFFLLGEQLLVRRSPLGHMPCYYAMIPGGTLIASDPLLLREPGGLVMRPDWSAVAKQLIAPTLRRRDTCLAGVRELGAGEQLELTHAPKVTPTWSPWDHVAANARSATAQDAADHLRQEICDGVAAQTTRDDPTVLLLSGGLDSSIVAASLAAAGRDCTALNMVTHASGGDERAHARRVAEHCGFPLVEVVREASAVDVTRSLSADRPYPSESSFAQATSAAAMAIAHDSNATAILDGGGGDNIFCSLTSAAPLTDLLRHLHSSARIVPLLRDIATVTQASHTAVLGQAIRRLMRRPEYRWRGDLALLSTEATTYNVDACAHPWLDAPRSALPGKAGHIGLLLAAMSLVQSPAATVAVPSRSILLTQPIVEACLSVPSWLWFERGRNRAMARRAFAPLLPEAAAWRLTKGAMNSFIVEIFERNRHLIREMLADGQLVQRGLVDRAAVLAAVDMTGPVRGRSYGRIMQFVDLEAWLAIWDR